MQIFSLQSNKAPQRRNISLGLATTSSNSGNAKRTNTFSLENLAYLAFLKAFRF